MEDTFDLAAVAGEAALVFQHMEADAHCGASEFWTKRSGAIGGEQAMIEYWQVRREGGHRGHCRTCAGGTMIANDRELQTTLDRIAWFQK